jgi:hypothetical protein
MRIYKRLAAALAVPLAVAGVAVAAGTAHAAPTTVTATTHIYNDPDSGNGGVWATDAFNRAVTVSVAADQTGIPAGSVRYTASISDSGTFVTHAGADTPNQYIAGQKISHAVTGTFSGSASYVIVAPSGDVLGSTFPADLNANNATLTGAQSTSDWPEQALTPDTGASVTLGNWSWTYTDKAGETWVDSSVNGDGNTVADGNITGLTVMPTKVPVLSHGHATSTAATRETVSYQQSGAASWDMFYIVGPGAINGHRGWVYGSLGTNFGYYEGLEANHGYTVYYTPVEGQGSTVQIPRTHTGYVYFVSNSNRASTASYVKAA